MIDRMLFFRDRTMCLEADGSLFSVADGGLSKSLDPFSLHDAVILGCWYESLTSDGPLIALTGVFPQLTHVFEVRFIGCRKIEATELSKFGQLGIQSMEVGRLESGVLVRITGEFHGQVVQIQCESAIFQRYSLADPLTRNELGWDN